VLSTLLDSRPRFEDRLDDFDINDDFEEKFDLDGDLRLYLLTLERLVRCLSLDFFLADDFVVFIVEDNLAV
jgi:hypothetical protein